MVMNNNLLGYQLPLRKIVVLRIEEGRASQKERRRSSKRFARRKNTKGSEEEVHQYPQPSSSKDDKCLPENSSLSLE